MEGVSARDAVERIGSIQAQHPEWPPVALAGRSANERTADLAGALDRRELVRSSLMRITIHVVTAEDLWPMFTVCQPLRLAQWRLLAKEDPVASDLGRRLVAAHPVAIAALSEGPRSSTELDRLLEAEAGPIRTAARRIHWRHLAALVPMVHVPHAGEGYGRSRYAIAADWLQVDPPRLDLAMARARVARRYIAAFGPATVEDLAAYVGRGRGGIGVWRRAVESIADELCPFRDDKGRTLLDLATAPRPDATTEAPPRLLARWDSLLLSHEPKHRDRVIANEHREAVFSRNADVRPTFLVDGTVAGTWDLVRDTESTALELRPFATIRRRELDLLGAEAERVLAILAPGIVDRRVAILG
ncbi:MAG: winged helix DNA-binding domain-containing protein [Candidatus Limnocylindria bacterium]